MSRPAYRPDRLARAIRLVLGGGVQRLGAGKYRVVGQDEPSYDVDLTGDPVCYCADQYHRGRAINGHCKHSLAARLAGLDPSLVQVLADRIEREQQEAEDQRLAEELAESVKRTTKPRRRKETA